MRLAGFESECPVKAHERLQPNKFSDHFAGPVVAIVCPPQMPQHQALVIQSFSSDVLEEGNALVEVAALSTKKGMHIVMTCGSEDDA